MPALTNSYQGQKASLLTQHGKESVICPELHASTGLDVIHVTGFNTDTLGTFTRDVARQGNQLAAARTKAKIGMDLSGFSIGIASEGAFDVDPFMGVLAWNYEIVIFIDADRCLEIIGFASGQAQSAHQLVSNWDELKPFLITAQFPSHHVVVRPDNEHHSELRKGINSLDSLKEAYSWAHHLSKDGKVFVENDLRAHANPTRMALIQKATQDLSQKIASSCPRCNSPGFWITESIKGLPCSECGSPTQLPLANVWSCGACQQRTEKPISPSALADPMKCHYCNP